MWLIFVLVMMGQIFSYLYLQATAPREPDASIGAIYLTRMQGDTVFLTKAQSYFCNGPISDIGLFFFGLPVIFWEVWAQQKKRKEGERQD